MRERLAAGAVVLMLAGMLGGCAAPPIDTPSVAAPTVEEDAVTDDDQWVVVTFGGAGEPMPADWMDALLPTEMAAAAALEQSGLGYIDGNEIGEYEYELYFAGSDAAAMWDVLAPSFADAPVAWTRVELRVGLDDGAPTVLVP